MERSLSIHQGKTVANVNDERACRTKLAVQTNAEKLFDNWNKKNNFGWHRVTFYGDFRKQIINF